MNKRVIITGGTSGYGLATAKMFKENGFTVLITARHADALAKAQAAGAADYVFVQDVSRMADWQALYAFAHEKMGGVDILVNNAGGGLSIKPIEEQSEEAIDAIIKLNLNSVMYAANVFVPEMKERKSGTIINISSVCATHAWADWSVYAAAKAGVLNFTKGLQVELQPHGVRATCIIPASASTGFQSAAGIGETVDSLSCDDIASAVYYAATLPARAIVEEMTVWGMSQMVQPL
jgi:NADP-dependent 3-hydroxy acid dehydrogenase YdfG